MFEKASILVESADFELPGGIKIKLAPLNRESFDRLDKWVRIRYMQNIRFVLQGLDAKEQMSILNQAAKDAALMSTRTEEGMAVLYESVHGYSRLCYELIVSPPFSFEEFDKMIFPDNGSLDNVGVLSKMFFAVYDEMFSKNIENLFDVVSETKGAESISSDL